ncbi:hypothetical protein C1H46_005212 [Malus baccata]|uniref:Uncharacterized protein n=1 Tax=Malus baccata TaxID=106549 RepID=A0A540NE07_MALBA|nr:hypothetical protein C1H46_005212 [Malus baccata]
MITLKHASFQESVKLENIPNRLLYLMYPIELEFLREKLEIIHVRGVFPLPDKSEKDKVFQNSNNFAHYQFRNKTHWFQH